MWSLTSMCTVGYLWFKEMDWKIREYIKIANVSFCHGKSPQVLVHPPYLRFKTQVKHAISLVEHHIRHSSQVGHPPSIGSQHVDHSTWSAHDDFCSSLQLCYLLWYSCATIHTANPQVILCKFLAFFTCVGDIILTFISCTLVYILVSCTSIKTY